MSKKMKKISLFKLGYKSLGGRSSAQLKESAIGAGRGEDGIKAGGGTGREHVS